MRPLSRLRPRRVLALVIAPAALGAVLLAGCSEPSDKAPPPASGMSKRAVPMGMGSQALGAEEAPPMPSGPMPMGGIVAGSRYARLEVANQIGARGELQVERVLAPADSWIVASEQLPDGSSGKVVGVLRVTRGEHQDLKVPLSTDVLTPRLVVSLNQDRGVQARFEFDPKRFESSPDRPYYVDGAALAAYPRVRTYGVGTSAGQAALQALDQPEASARGEIAIDREIAPTAAWIVAYDAVSPERTEPLGLLHVPAGEHADIVLRLTRAPASRRVVLELFQDAGKQGTFEFDPADPNGSVDQPFFSQGRKVSVPVAVR
jgi:hypothetical protein